MEVLWIFIAMWAACMGGIMLFFGVSPTSRVLREPGPKQFDGMKCVEGGKTVYYIDPATIERRVDV